jgi:2'-hydroxyisoflavone reductase
MTSDRRQFLKLSAASAAGLALTGLHSHAHAAAISRPPAKLKILILGGTSFLGPAIVNAAIAKGHEVTLFNRGKTNPTLFPEIEKLRGDRDPAKDEGLKALEGRKWDAVVDTSAYVPRHAKASAELLAPNVGHYVFISTISVYAKNDTDNGDESSELGKLEDPANEKVSDVTYGPLKALCEQAAETAMPGRVCTIRPGFIVGREDPTGRFTYWPLRIAKGGDVLAAGTPDDPIQVIDVRDLGEWIVKCIEDKTVGIYNATGPEKKLSVGAFLEGIRTGVKSDAKFVFADFEFLQTNGKPGDWLPLMIPPSGESKGFHTRNCAKAIAKGLKFRPISETAADTLAWWKTETEEFKAKQRFTFNEEREKELLALLKK